MYKPTGPDGKGWGKFRKLDEYDKIEFEKIKNSQQEKDIKDNMQFVSKDIQIDEDKPWEEKFINIMKKKNEIIDNQIKKFVKKKKLDNDN